MLKFITSVGIALGCIVGFVLIAMTWLFLSTPRPTNIRDCLTTQLFEVHLCPKDANYVKIGAMSAAAKNAVLVSEDSAFYDHHGFDWFELRQSAEKNWTKHEFARGGSTITQQLAKNVYLTNEKSLLRKVREAIITVQLEKHLTKNEILEKYLNVVEFGPELYGIGAASKFYFHKSAASLTPAEGAFLAFLLPNPKTYSGSFRKKHLSKFAHSQMRVIVDRLFHFGRISEDEHAAAVYQVDHFFGTSDFENGDFDPSAQPSGEEAVPDDALNETIEAKALRDYTAPPDDEEPNNDSSN